jgi:MFS family permease
VSSILIVVLGSIAAGFAIAYPSPAGPTLAADLEFTTFERNMFNSIMPLASILGPMMTNSFLDHQGRRFALRMIALIHFLGWIILLFAPVSHKWCAIAHRGVLGLGQGGYYTVSPIYILELSPIELRSLYGSFHQASVSLGCFVCNLLGCFCGWWMLSLILCTAPLFQFVLSYVIIESPVSARKLDIPLLNDRKSLANRKYWRPLAIGLALCFLQQFAGISPIQVNLSQLMRSRLGPTIAASSKFLAGFFCAPLIRCLNRSVV